MKNNPHIKKIIFLVQPLFIFAGVLSAIVIYCTGMELNVNLKNIWPLLFIVCYGLMFVYRYLDKEPGGRWLGLIAVGFLELVVLFRFFTPIVKGAQYIINNYIKQLIAYMHIKLELIPYLSNSREFTDEYCITLFFAAFGTLLIAIISFCFYTKRRALPFYLCTLPLVVLPGFVGNVMNYWHMFFYAVSIIVITGTGHIAGKCVKEEVRNKTAVILAGTTILCAVLGVVVMTPERHTITAPLRGDARAVLLDMENYSPLDWSSWVKANFGADAIDYGMVASKGEIHYTGDTLIEIQSDGGLYGNIYLKGFVGDKLVNNRWKPFDKSDGQYLQDKAALQKRGFDLDNWAEVLLAQTEGLEEKVKDKIYGYMPLGNNWDVKNFMTIRNVALGRGNRVLPYYVEGGYRYGKDGKISYPSETTYQVGYYETLADTFFDKRGTEYADFRAQYILNEDGKYSREDFSDVRRFAYRYYLEVPKEYRILFQDFLGNYKRSPNNIDDTIWDVRNYLARSAEYTLSPGETPDDEDAISYFLENKKGYCVQFASAATMLFRGVGVPARYVEGVAARLPHYTDKTVQLKDKNAHAWVEIYCDDIGWLPVEVTPEGGGGTKSRPLQPAEIKDSKKPKKEKETETEDAESFEPEEGEPEEDIPPEEDVPPEEEQPVEEDLSEDETMEEDEEVPEEETDEEEMEYDDTEDETQTGGVDQPAGQSESKPENGWNLQALIVLAIVVAVFVLVHGQYLLRKWVYRKRLRKLDKRSRVIRMFLHSRPLLAKYGVSYEGETSREYAAGLAEATGLSEESVRPFVYGLLKAEFGGNHLTEEESKEFVQAYRKITRALFGKMKLPMRILFLYIHGGR